ncbi:hypothetical protein, partial [Raoultella planticola]|uniref:hypothetical protein n=1 Tax=Raoultella planticola TaxID=575 RepID=UPI002148CFDB
MALPGLGRCVRRPNPACCRCVPGLTRPGALRSWTSPGLLAQDPRPYPAGRAAFADPTRHSDVASQR